MGLWKRVLAIGIALAAAIGIWACKRPGAQPASSTEQATPEVVLVVPERTPAPTATASPAADMLFEADGDIYFSEAYQAAYTAGAFPFDHTPRVLIYHTHTEEAFRESARRGGTGETASSVRSTDPEKNVVRLGELLRMELVRRGFTVIHDGTDNELPELSTAYARSRTVMEQYEDIDLYIDLHRNAADMERGRNDVVTLEGVRTARLFFVVGTGLTEGSAAGETANWRKNYRFALSLTEWLRGEDEGLAKDVRVKQKIYNQDLGLSLLVEVGHNANRLAEAEAAIPHLADALAAVCVFPKE